MKLHASNDAKKILILQSIFTLATGLSSLFVNIFLWKINSNIVSVAIFNLCVFSGSILFFSLSGWISRKKSITFCMRLGIGGYVLFYLSILFLNVYAKDYLVYLGIIMGASMSFYFYAYHTLVISCTTPENRSAFLGICTSLNSIMGILAPTISGWIIYINSDFIGYRIIFFISFILFIAIIFISRRLSDICQSGKFMLIDILFYNRNFNWKKVIISNFILGLRDGTFSFLINILLFLIYKNEFGMGKYITFTSLISVISSYFVGKYAGRIRRRNFFFIGVFTTFLSSVILVLYTNPIGVIVYGILNAVFMHFWQIPFSTICYETIEQSIRKNEAIGDYMIAREIPLGLGRVFGIVAFIYTQKILMQGNSIKILLPFINFILIIMYLYLFFNKPNIKYKTANYTSK